MAPVKRVWERLDLLVHSIRFRLVLWFTAILAVVLLVFSIFVYWSQARDLRIDAYGRMQHRMAEIAGVLPQGFVDMGIQANGMSAISLPASFLQSNEVLVIIGPSGKLVGNWGPVPADQVIQIAQHSIEQHPPHGNEPITSAAYQGASQNYTDYAFTVSPIMDEGTLDGFLIYGSPIDPTGELPRLILTLLAGSLLTLVFTVGGGFWLADRAMRPVRTITHAAQTISETDLSRRLTLHSKDELGELANTFDGMLARLDAAFQRQRQFVADASHELRTPLTIVNLEATRALASQRKTPEYERALGVIRSENDFMIRLVNDLLTLARMDAGQAVLQKQSLDLSDVALEAVERLSSLAARNQVTLEAGDMPEAQIIGDRQYLLQMISNLIENGIKYTTGNERRVYVESGLQDGYAWVRISDNGPGIEQSYLQHLFDRFYQVDKARSRQEPQEDDSQGPSGSGLGLSIVQWIVQAHGGTVGVESTPGEGTTFEVRIPAAGENESPDD